MNLGKLYDLPTKVTVKKVIWLKQRLNIYYVTMTLQKNESINSNKKKKYSPLQVNKNAYLMKLPYNRKSILKNMFLVIESILVYKFC